MDSPTSSMTWQQQQQFGHATATKNKGPNDQKSGCPRYKPFDYEVSAPPSNTVVDTSWRAQQSRPTSAEPSPQPLHCNTDTRRLRRPPRKRSAPSKAQQGRNGNMGKLPLSAYIPPHLRKRNPVNKSKPDSAVGTAATDSSPTATNRSKGRNATTQLQSSPNSVKIISSSPPSLPTSPQDSEHLRGNAWAELVDHKPDVPQPVKRRVQNQRWPRGPQPSKKNVWPKSRDMRPLPSASSDGGILFKSDSNGDPDYDIKKLVDYEGKWMPPPEQWQARKGFSERHYEQVIEKWINGHSEECTKPIPGGLRPIEDGACVDKELVPRYWADSKVEDMTLRDFWRELPCRAPKALSDMEMTDDQPWWDRYEVPMSWYIDGLEVPDARVDHNNVENDFSLASLHTAMASTEEKVTSKRNKDIERQKRRIARQMRPVAQPHMSLSPMDDKRIRPTANVYLRPVQASDVQGIAEIYNHYIENTIHANEFERRTNAHIADRVNDIVTAGLPYLVAVAKGNRPKGQPGYICEKIVGYIDLDDYGNRSSIYRYTFKLELFVHPGFVCKGIAKCLLDRLLEMVNTGYNARGGYEYVNNFEYLKNGPSRVVKTILLDVHHEHGSDIAPTKKYLSDFRFSRCGHVCQAGYKKDKVVDISMFQHHTTEDIDPRSIPTVVL